MNRHETPPQEHRDPTMTDEDQGATKAPEPAADDAETGIVSGYDDIDGALAAHDDLVVVGLLGELAQRRLAAAGQDQPGFLEQSLLEVLETIPDLTGGFGQTVVMKLGARLVTCAERIATALEAQQADALVIGQTDGRVDVHVMSSPSVQRALGAIEAQQADGKLAGHPVREALPLLRRIADALDAQADAFHPKAQAEAPDSARVEGVRLVYDLLPQEGQKLVQQAGGTVVGHQQDAGMVDAVASFASITLDTLMALAEVAPGRVLHRDPERGGREFVEVPDVVQWVARMVPDASGVLRPAAGGGV